MIKRRIKYPAQGRNEDYKFGSGVATTLGVSTATTGGGTVTEASWLEQYFTFDVVNDVLQLSRAMTIQGEKVYTDAYKPLADNATNLGGFSAASYPRKAEAAVITGNWEFTSFIQTNGLKIGTGHESWADVSIKLATARTAHIVSEGATSINAMLRVDSGAGINLLRVQENGLVGLGVIPTERLTVAGNGLFTGNISAVNAALSGALGVTGNVTAGGNVQGAGTFFSGFAGSNWRLESGAENHLTVDRLTVRGRMDVYELVVNQIRATNGSLWVSDAMKTTTAERSTGWLNQYIQLNFDNDNGRKPLSFAANDIVRAQRFDGRNVIQVTGRVDQTGSNFFRINTNGFQSDYTGDLSKLDGLDFVRIGNTNSSSGRQGSLYLTSSDDGSPYMDVLDGVNSASFAGKTKLRIGKISGISGQSGYGIWGSQNGNDTSFVISSDGYAEIAGWNFDSNFLYAGGKYGSGTAGLELQNSGTTKRLMIHDGGSLNWVNLHHYDASNWGIRGRVGGKDVFRLGSVNQIAGITFDDSRIYTSQYQLNKDGSFSFANGKIAGTAAGALTIDGGVVTGNIKSENYNSTTGTGSQFDLTNGNLTIGGAISVDSFNSELKVKNRATGNNIIRIGDFPLSDVSDVSYNYSIPINSANASLTSSSAYTINGIGYLDSYNRTDVLIRSSTTGTQYYLVDNLTIGSSYQFRLKGIYLRMDANTPLVTLDYPYPYLGFSGGYVKVQLKNGSTVVSEYNYNTTTDGIMELDEIYLSFVAVSGYLQLVITPIGDFYHHSQGSGITTIRSNCRLTINRNVSYSNVMLFSITNSLELSTRGFQIAFSSNNYQKIKSTGFETRAAQTYTSPNGLYGLRITDTAVFIKRNGGAWTAL